MFLSNANDFDPTGPVQRLHVTVTHDGKPMPRTQYGRSIGGATGSDKGFGPGSRAVRHLSINSIYDMTLPGDYQVYAIAPVAGRITPGKETPSFLAKSAPITVRINGDCR